MKRLTLITVLGIFSIFALQAQEDMKMTSKDAKPNNELASTTTEKTYKILMGDKVIRNSVKIHTELSQEILLADEDAGMVNQDRVLPKKKIVKTVKIDNDADDQYDELIRFSYRAYADTDFVLVSNDDQLFVALDKGENLEIMQNNGILISDLKNGTESFVFTDNNGKEVEFFIDEYKSLDDTSRM